MTQEDKDLLVKDLCARLPYSVWGLHRGEDLPLYVIDNSGAYMVLGYNTWFDLETVPFKPYLRPMSSMTRDESFELGEILLDLGSSNVMTNVIDFYNAHHFDHRGLIEKGLALEAPEGMYKIK